MRYKFGNYFVLPLGSGAPNFRRNCRGACVFNVFLGPGLARAEGTPLVCIPVQDLKFAYRQLSRQPLHNLAQSFVSRLSRTFLSIINSWLQIHSIAQGDLVFHPPRTRTHTPISTQCTHTLTHAAPTAYTHML